MFYNDWNVITAHLLLDWSAIFSDALLLSKAMMTFSLINIFKPML